MNNLSIAVITGLSGAGKSTAVKALEDMGYYTVDNMPLLIIEKFVELFFDLGVATTKIALVIDMRSGDSEKAYKVIDLLKQRHNAKIVFLTTSKEILLKRYKASRRKHPLKGDLEEAIDSENLIMEPIKDIADSIIDTSAMNVHELSDRVTEFFLEQKDMLITVSSFGFKHGLPLDSDLVFDVRFIRNPFFVESMRDRTGLDGDVYDYVMKDPRTGELLGKLTELLAFLIPNYSMEGKRFLKISIGCTGGKHRSVAIAEYIKGYLTDRCKDTPVKVQVKHRDVELI
ncbi:MAG: RNase adapter RapZ [Deferribacteraceae bacterium]|jgi:UPF0042 nucleotide-binding protein|nr:RNase adapter RapZ [Deferribacteraceae bacterium]